MPELMRCAGCHRRFMVAKAEPVAPQEPPGWRCSWCRAAEYEARIALRRKAKAWLKSTPGAVAREQLIARAAGGRTETA